MKAEGEDGLRDQFFLSDLGETQRRIADPGLHYWFGVANRKSEGSGDESNLGFARFLFVDLDNIDTEGALQQIVRESELPLPTFLVNSGHGVHAYWELEKPLDLSQEENIVKFKRAEEAISAAVNGDERVKDAARVLRVPGTWNPKEPRAYCYMVKRGRETYPFETFDPGEGIDRLIWVWKHTKVHQLALGFAGWCYHKGVDQENAEDILTQVVSAANDPEIGDRLRCIRDAYEGGAQGREIAYKPHLESRMGKLVLQALVEIWGRRPEGGPLIPVVEGKQYVQPTSASIDYLFRRVFKTGETWERAHVLSVPMRITHAYDVEGTFAVRSWYRDRMGDVSEVVDFSDLPRLLRQRGLVMRDRLLQDTLGALRTYHINNGVQIEVSHPGPGYYHHDGRWELHLEQAIPLTTPQELVKRSMMERRDPLSKKKLETYLKVRDFFEDQEILPIMGLAAITPFLFELKREGLLHLAPDVFIVGPHGLGKTTLNAIFTSSFYRVPKITGKAIDSQFRLDDYLNATTFPLHVEEGEDVDFDAHAPKLKAAAESGFLSSKGKPSREQDVYLARSLLFLDGNQFPIHDWNLMIRFILIEIDERLREERHKNAPEFDKLLRDLDPVGVSFSLVLANWMNESAESARTTALYLLADTIEKTKERLQEMDFIDVRRAVLWAVVYTGLLFWEKVCKEHKIDFSVDLDTFKAKVIRPLERAIQEGRPMLPGERFREWWIWTLAHNTRRTVVAGTEMRETLGEGEYFIQDDEAWYISQAALQRFDGGRHRLAGIASALAEAYGGTKEAYYHRKMYEQMRDGRKVRVLRLRKSEESGTGPLERFGGPGKQETFLSQVEQVRLILEFMRENRGRYMSPEEVEQATGVHGPVPYLTRLANEGRVEVLEGNFRFPGSPPPTEQDEDEPTAPESDLADEARGIHRSDPRRPRAFVVQDLVDYHPEMPREDIEAIVGTVFAEDEDNGE